MADNTVSLPLTGMTCANCAANIERSLSRLEGVRQVNVNFASERAEVIFNPARLTVQDVIERVRKSGYEVPLGRVEMPITGMTCANCVANVERALKKKVDGVVDASVNFGSERASVTYLPDRVTIEQIVAAIEKAGYGAVVPEEGEAGQDAELAARQAEVRDQTRKFIVGVIFTTPCSSSACCATSKFWGPGRTPCGSTGCCGLLRRRSSFTPAGIIMWAATRACATGAPIWMCSWRWAPRWPISIHWPC
jgi:P-type Cu+ transporter